MAVEYNISQLIALASNVRYFPKVGEAINRVLSATSPVEYDAALEEATSLAFAETNFSRGYKSQFGLPLFMPLEIESFERGVDNLLLESAVVDFSESKNIVITEVQGRDNSIDEFINNGYSQMSFSGIIAGRGFGYPLDEVELFKAFMRSNKPLRIVHEQLNMLDVFDIVVTDWKLPKSPYANIQLYSFDCKSSVPIELTINE